MKKQIIHYDWVAGFAACGVFIFGRVGRLYRTTFLKRKVTCKRCRKTKEFILAGE